MALTKNFTLGPLMLDIEGTGLSSEEAKILEHPLVGGLILFSRNYESVYQLATLIHSIRQHAPNILIAVDHEGGRVQRFREGFSAIPPMLSLEQLYAVNSANALATAKEWGWLMAAELRCVDIDISFAPVLDLHYGNSEVIGDRAFSSDPRVAAELSFAFVSGMKEAGMASTGKHFPGHGYVAADSHVDIPVDTRPYLEIASKDIKVFENLVAKGLDGIMPAHVIYSSVDEKPAGFSSFWLQNQLRGELQFDGVIFSDDLDMAGAAAEGSFPDRAKAALDAGCDMVLVCNNPKGAREVLSYLERAPESFENTRVAKMKGKTFKYSSLDELQCDARWLRAQNSLNAAQSLP